MPGCLAVAFPLPGFIEIRVFESDNETSGIADLDFHTDTSAFTAPDFSETMTQLMPEAVEFNAGEHRTDNWYLGDQLMESNQLSQQALTTIGTLSAKGSQDKDSRSIRPQPFSEASRETFSADLNPRILLGNQSPLTDIPTESTRVASLTVASVSRQTNCLTSNDHSALGQAPTSRNVLPPELEILPGSMFNLELIDTWTSRIPFFRFEEHLQSQGIDPILPKTSLHGVRVTPLASTVKIPTSPLPRLRPPSVFA